MSTPREVAEWMLSELRSTDYMEQEALVHEIAEKFGQQFTYENDRGNLAIDREVLAEFRKISEPDFVWDSGQKAWRKREPFDEPGRKQR